MLWKEHNDLLTQSGPGTAMGSLFRSYWVPALLPEELPDNDCPPVRAKLPEDAGVSLLDFTNSRLEPGQAPSTTSREGQRGDGGR